MLDNYGISAEQLHADAMENAPVVRPAQIKGMSGFRIYLMLIIIMRNFGIEVGNRLQELRKNAGYTQEQLVEKINISPNALSNYETGIRLMRIDTAQEVSDALGKAEFTKAGNSKEER